MNFDSTAPLWDFSQSTDYNSLGHLGEEQFLELLQKQFSQEFNPITPVSLTHDAVVDPSKLTSLPAPNPPPPLSTDSSPSPSSVNERSSASRRQSQSFDHDGEPAQKRKATDDDDDLEEGPSHKTSKKNPPRRKGAGTQDENRLQKRKEQNRAAQRAFRERKEKHVKDLEDKVAALEAKNEMSETENQHLRELLKRLQDENVMLKQAQFTFTVPKPSSSSDATQGLGNVATASFGSSPNSAFGAGPSSATSVTSPTPPSSSLDTPSSQFPSDIDFGALTSFDPSQLTMLDENGDTAMPYDFGGFGQVVPSTTPYKTIASNTMFMSFAEPSPPSDFSPAGDSSKPSPPSSSASPFDSAFTSWSGASTARADPSVAGRTGSFDELFGGHMFGNQSPMSPASFTSLMSASGSAAISPVLHARNSPTSANGKGNGNSSNSNSPGKDQQAQHDTGSCPKTREEFAAVVSKSGASPFAPSPDAPPSIPAGSGAMPALHKALAGDGAGPMIMCKGASFPPTEKRDDNVEVLAAWRSITNHPHFKASNIDINELCAEFTDKARCDGTKIVLDKQGVNYIISRLTAKYSASP